MMEGSTGMMLRKSFIMVVFISLLVLPIAVLVKYMYANRIDKTHEENSNA